VPDPGRESLAAAARVGLRFVVRDPYVRVLAAFGAMSDLPPHPPAEQPAWPAPPVPGRPDALTAV
jgi:hypothetical protein